MRNVLRFLARPGVFIAVVGIIVCVCAAGLWGGMTSRTSGHAASSGEVQDINPAIARALLSMAHLAYEEPFEGHLEDSVKQTDFALLQAMLRNDMPLKDARVEKTELRHNNAESYHFQRVRLTVGSDPAPFVAHLRESLDAWAENTVLSRSGPEKDNGAAALWHIAVNGVVTHELVLAPLPPSTTGPGKIEEPGRELRRRAPGETARLVIVIDDIGEDMGAVKTLVGLPYPVTFAIWPRSTHARKAAEQGHAAGVEILIHQPTEPMKYPEVNPGPGALFASLPDAEIEARVKDSVTRVPHAVGMNNHMGSRFTRNARAAAAMVRPLQSQGFFVLDSLTHPGSVLYAEARKQGIPALRRDVFLDSVPGKEQVLRQLRKAEKIALVAGRAVAIGHPLPGTLAALREWNARRDPQVELVRLSDLLFIR